MFSILSWNFLMAWKRQRKLFSRGNRIILVIMFFNLPNTLVSLDASRTTWKSCFLLDDLLMTPAETWRIQCSIIDRILERYTSTSTSLGTIKTLLSASTSSRSIWFSLYSENVQNDECTITSILTQRSCEKIVSRLNVMVIKFRFVRFHRGLSP